MNTRISVAGSLLALTSVAVSSAVILKAEDSNLVEPRRILALYDADNLVETSIGTGPEGLFGMRIRCTLDGSSAAIEFNANQEGVDYPLWPEPGVFDELHVVAVAQCGSNLTPEIPIEISSIFSETLDFSGPDAFHVLECMSQGDSRLTVTLTNPAGERYRETFVSGNWRGLAALCGVNSRGSSVAASSKESVLVNTVLSAVDRFREEQ